MEIKPIARIKTGFKEKFGLPRNSGRVEIAGKIVFEPEFRKAEALKGIEEYNYLWLIFDFNSGVYGRALLDFVQVWFEAWGAYEWGRKGKSNF